MFKLKPYLVRMAGFVSVVAVLAGVLYPSLSKAFMANAPLNGLILSVFLFGIVFVFRQVFILRREAAWIEATKNARDGRGHSNGRNNGLESIPEPKLLAPVATLLGDPTGSLRLTTSSMRSLLDSIDSRLDESRALSRYLIGLLIFLGLLGTFWGLLITINSVSGVIRGLNLGNGDMAAVFTRLKEGLAAPLTGMGTAFSSSLFGLAGSLVLGFLDLQSGQAQNRFYNDFEEWLSSLTRLSAPGPMIQGQGDGTMPDYVQALLEQSAEGLNSLQSTLARGEESRITTNNAVNQLSEKLSTLTDQMRSEQSLLVKLAESQLELQPLLARLSNTLDKDNNVLDDATRGHIRNMEVYLARLLEEGSSGRAQAVDEIRSEIKILSRTIAAGKD